MERTRFAAQTIAVALLLAGCALTMPAQPAQGRECEATELAKLTASDAYSLDRFGQVAIDGNTAVIGAFNGGGIGSPYRPGAAYVFQFDGSAWVQVAKLTSSDLATDDEFGGSVAIAGDVIVIAAMQHDHGGGWYSGAAYVFEKPVSGWTDMTETAELTASDAAPNDLFATLAMSGDTIVIGAFNDDDGGSNSGSAYVFEKPVGGWGSVGSPIHETDKLTASDAAPNNRFGSGIAIDDGTAVIGADQNGVGPGVAYVFEKLEGYWVPTATLTASDPDTNDNFGWAVAVRGDTIGVGAYADDEAGNNAGAAYVFEKPPGGWSDMTENAKLMASDATAGDNLGLSVSISPVGALLAGAWAIGNNRPGFTYVFERSGGSWVDSAETARLAASDGEPGDIFGARVSTSGDFAIVGAWRDDHAGGTGAGAAYVFRGLSDCNTNGTLDICDIANGTSQDMNANGIPDECECWTPGDMNGDGELNADDIPLFIQRLLNS